MSTNADPTRPETRLETRPDMPADIPAPGTRRADARSSHSHSRRGRPAVFALIAAFALVALACGSSDDSTDTGGATSTTAASSADGGYGYGDNSSKSSTTTAADTAGATSVAVGTTSLGDVVVDGEGYTLYLFENDTGPTSTCTDACADAWPAATVTGTPSAGPGVTGALTTTTRPDGTTQIVLAGHPLYRYAGDGAPGDVTGQEVGDVWYVVSPAGESVE